MVFFYFFVFVFFCLLRRSSRFICLLIIATSVMMMPVKGEPFLSFSLFMTGKFPFFPSLHLPLVCFGR